MEQGWAYSIAEALAAPATVCEERLFAKATGKLGRQNTSNDSQARKPAITSVTLPPNGVFWWDGYPVIGGALICVITKSTTAKWGFLLQIPKKSSTAA